MTTAHNTYFHCNETTHFLVKDENGKLTPNTGPDTMLIGQIKVNGIEHFFESQIFKARHATEEETKDFIKNMFQSFALLMNKYLNN